MKNFSIALVLLIVAFVAALLFADLAAKATQQFARARPAAGDVVDLGAGGETVLAGGMSETLAFHRLLTRHAETNRHSTPCLAQVRGGAV